MEASNFTQRATIPFNGEFINYFNINDSNKVITSMLIGVNPAFLYKCDSLKCSKSFAQILTDVESNYYVNTTDLCEDIFNMLDASDSCLVF